MEIRERAYRVTYDLIKDTKWMYNEHLVGIYATLVNNYSLPNTQETVYGMQEAIIDEYFNGCEPEWASMDAERWWFGMNTDYFKSNDKEIDAYKWLVVPPRRLFM